MRTLIIGFSTSNGCLARLIRWASRSKVSHTYVRIPLRRRNHALIFQASGLSVNIESASHFVTHATVVQEIVFQVSDEQWQKFEDFMFDSLGKKYSFAQLVGMGWVMLCRNLGLRVKNPFGDGDHSYVCVELVANILGIPNSEEMTPQDLLELLQAHQVEL